MKRIFWLALLIAAQCTAAIANNVKQFENNVQNVMEQVLKSQEIKLISDLENEQGSLCQQSTKLSLGKVARHTNNAMTPYPFFIVSDDHLSMKWLHKNKQRLSKMNAFGVVVNIKQGNDTSQLEKISGELPIFCLPVDELVDVFNLQHYPVLVTDSVIEQ